MVCCRRGACETMPWKGSMGNPASGGKGKPLQFLSWLAHPASSSQVISTGQATDFPFHTRARAAMAIGMAHSWAGPMPVDFQFAEQPSSIWPARAHTSHSAAAGSLVSTLGPHLYHYFGPSDGATTKNYPYPKKKKSNFHSRTIAKV